MSTNGHPLEKLIAAAQLCFEQQDIQRGLAIINALKNRDIKREKIIDLELQGLQQELLFLSTQTEQHKSDPQAWIHLFRAQLISP